MSFVPNYCFAKETLKAPLLSALAVTKTMSRSSPFAPASVVLDTVVSASVTPLTFGADGAGLSPTVTLVSDSYYLRIFCRNDKFCTRFLFCYRNFKGTELSVVVLNAADKIQKKLQ